MRRRVIDLLLRSRGADVLEQLIGLETAATTVAEMGLVITQNDVDREREQTLRNLSDPLPSLTPQEFDPQAAERLLDAVLAQRGMSREEFEIITRRNAYLRKIVETRQVFTEEQLKQEFERAYGERAVVRHIQLGTLPEVTRVKEALEAGESFAELVGRYSANRASAKRGGLLEPFSENDDQIPGAFRRAAFLLKPGEVSGAVRVGKWYHLITLESVLEAQKHDFEVVREELRQSLRRRLTKPAMYELFEKLFTEATIEILDPTLEAAFDFEHTDRVR